MSEKSLNEALTKIFEDFERTLPKKNAQVMRSLERSRLTINDTLDKYANEAGVIPRARVNTVIQELAPVEGEMYRNVRDEIRSVIEDTGSATAILVVEALLVAIGAAALAEFLGIGVEIVKLGAEAILTAGVGLTLAALVLLIWNTTSRRRESDRRRLNDRLRILSADMQREITQILRKSIRQGEVTSDISSKIVRKVKEAKNRIKRLVETEALYALRLTKALIAEKTGVASALRIQDYEHGSHAVHKQHMCYVYAHRDEHGLGMGVYPVTTKKIRNPHPNCRSTLHYVLKEEVR